MFQQIYDSAWNLPGVAFLSVTLLFVALARKLPFIAGYSVLFAWLIAMDAWVNGALSPVPAGSRRLLEITFVVIGDWRYFLLLEYYSGGNLNIWRWLRSILFACLVPAITLVVIQLSSGKLDSRGIFLFYEVAFFALALALLFFVLPRRRDASVEGRKFLDALTQFELMQYGLWAVADFLLIGGQSWAMALRLTANIFYYGLFLPFVWWRSPKSPVGAVRS